MNKNLHNIFAVSQCPSEEKLLEYVSGKLHPAEQNTVEKHLSGCEMCSDYADGLLLLKKPEDILQKSVGINAEIDILTAPKKRNLYNRFGLMAGIAAILTVLIIVTFILQKQFKNNTIQQVAQNKNETAPDATETAPLENAVEPVTAAEKSTLLRETSQNKMPDSRNPVENEQGYRFNEFAPGVRKDNQQFAGDKTEIAADFDAEDITVSERPVVIDEETDQLAEKALSEDDTKKLETVTLSQTTVSGGSHYKESSGKATGNTEQEADSGIVFFNAGDYRSSLTYFERKLKETPADQKAQWYLTLSLIRLGRTEEARVMLRTIIDAKGEYQKQAEKELKKLK